MRRANRDGSEGGVRRGDEGERRWRRRGTSGRNKLKIWLKTQLPNFKIIQKKENPTQLVFLKLPRAAQDV